MTPLRQRMTEDMQVRNLALNTQMSYVQQVSLFARHFDKSPEQLGPEDIRAYQIYLADEKKVAVSTRILAVSALRFFYAVTLQRDWTLQLIIPTPKKDHRLPVILSPQEVLQLLQAAPSFTHHVIFSTMYGTGMRVSEALHLRAANIDSQRMMIRIELSKGHKDRDVQLSPKLLELLRCYWRKVRPGEWMFPGEIPDQPLTCDAVSDAVARARQRAGLNKAVSPHSFRHYARVSDYAEYPFDLPILTGLQSCELGIARRLVLDWTMLGSWISHSISSSMTVLTQKRLMFLRAGH